MDFQFGFLRSALEEVIVVDLAAHLKANTNLKELKTRINQPVNGSTGIHLTL